MSRTRNLKPGFFKNEYLANLDPLARLLFQGLWCLADRSGRLEDRPRKIKVEVLPYDECDIEGLLNSLANAEEPFIIRYKLNGTSYIQITNFAKHQNPHPRESKSEIPEFIAASREKELSCCEKVLPSNRVASERSNRIYRESEVKEEKVKEEKKESIKPPYSEIIDYLNKKASTKYRATAKSTKEYINARFKEHFTLDDFKTVIDNKVADWLNTEQSIYLRPETLFCPKHFESYLNQRVPNKKSKQPDSALNRLKQKYNQEVNHDTG